ncbi:hypothetical protein EI94DRAFT_1697617 [Lactarius quietus]|nr:hypothetical protein EI94DRAFT_1697617 [Lactarius quietus]
MDAYPSSDEDDIDGDESPSSQSKSSYGMDSTHLPEGLDDFGLTAVPFHGVQGEGTELALPLDVTLRIDVLLLLGASEFEVADFPWATEPGEQFTSAAQEEDVGMDDLCELMLMSRGSPLAASKDTRVDELTGTPLAEGSKPHVQDDGFTPIFTTSLMLHDKMQRLHRIDNEIRQLYDNGLNLIAVVNGMRSSAAGRGNISDQSTSAALKINNTFPIQ